jgi:hypothetical protein
MIELVFSVCMLAQPQTCKDVHMTFLEQKVSAAQCMMNGQFQMAEWVNTHPEWKIERFKCQAVQTAGADI